MEILVARQPIFDRSLKVFAYELLYRSSASATEYDGVDGDAATKAVIVAAFMDIGIENITGSKPGFINFTENMLKDDIVKTLPNEKLGIEVLESVEPTADVLDACAELKELGYNIVLDDFLYNFETRKFINFANIIKMDFRNTPDEALKYIVEKYKMHGVKFLAEKVETKEEFLKAKAYGYDYFQGYYFCKPSVIQQKDIRPLQLNSLELLELLQASDDNLNITKMASIISYDPGMTYKLLKLANSVMYGSRNKISSVNASLVRIGVKELRSWLFYVLMQGMNDNKPDDLIKQSVFRAKAAAEICTRKKLSRDIEGFSLMGLFSLMDVMLDTPFEQLLSAISLSEEIKTALTEPGDDPHSIVMRLISSYDIAEWEEAEAAAKLIGITLKEYRDIYLELTAWCDERYSKVFN